MKKSKKHPRVPEPKEGEVRAPYWAHAHRDWRFLTVVFLMLAAIVIYLVTGDLSWVHHGQPLPLLAVSGK